MKYPSGRNKCAAATAWVTVLAVLCTGSGPASAAAAAAAAVAVAEPDAADLTLEELLRAEVVTVSRKPQTLQSTAAAAFVISRDDIERSGATNIPEVLRLAPGVQVARIANNRWAVSVRGFNGRFANKLLVLLDGRSIYSPLFSGTMWEFEDTLLEDVERIEVIRGPGAALWGANAVNGVINIITRKARDTQGGLAVAAVGSEERGLLALRQGMAVGDGHLRLWGKAFARDGSVTPGGAEGNDDWRALRGGFRGDWPLAGGGKLTLSGSAFGSATPDHWNVPDLNSASGSTPADITETGDGFHLLARREWAQADGADSVLQAYVERSDVTVKGQVRELRSTLDLDFQQRSRVAESHELVWGTGLRLSPDHIEAQGLVTVQKPRRNYRLLSAFVQDEVELAPLKLRLTVGVRLEHNNLTGFEPQPNARLIWTPTPSQSVWAALSRAVRTPSRAELDGAIELSVTPAAPPLPAVLTRNIAPGDGGLQSEHVSVAELGYRHLFSSRVSLDAAAFYADYTQLRSAQLDATQVLVSPSFVPYVQQSIVTNNSARARSHGIELSLDWHPTDWWRLQSNLSTLTVRGSTATTDPVTLGDTAGYQRNSPRQQASLRSSMTLDGRRQFDLWLRHVGSVDGAQGSMIPAYTTLDARFAWRPVPALELSLVGQNLLERRHAEFVTELLPSQPLLVQRSVYVKARWQY